ncbi:tetratricopeptide repeat protein [Nocardioides sp. WV_118_6]
MLRTTVAALILAGALATTACSGDPSPPSAASSASTASAASVESLVQTGLTQLGAGDAEQAGATFRTVLDQDAGNVYAHYNLGVIAEAAGDTATAATEYDNALATDPAFAPALFNRGVLHEPDDLDQAVRLYRRGPDLAAAHMRLGFALLHLGERAEAEEHLAAGVRLDPAMAGAEAPAYD